MRSTISASADGPQGVEPPLQPSEVVVRVSATLPAVAAMLIGVESITSGVGSGAPTAAVDASWTSRYWPGAIVPLRGVIRFVAEPKLPVPVALVYWIDQPESDTGSVLPLKSST